MNLRATSIVINAFSDLGVCGATALIRWQKWLVASYLPLIDRVGTRLVTFVRLRRLFALRLGLFLSLVVERERVTLQR